MKFIDLVKKRQSVRSYLNTPIEAEKLERCVEAARLAPSATNSQPWRFIVVDNPLLKDQVAKATYSPAISFNKFTLQAPALVVIAANKGNLLSKAGQRMTGLPYYLIDIGIAAEHFCLQAAEEGLGTCMIGWFNQKKIRQCLRISRNEHLSLIIAVGYPSSAEIREKKRKNIEEIYCRNQ